MTKVNFMFEEIEKTSGLLIGYAKVYVKEHISGPTVSSHVDISFTDAMRFCKSWDSHIWNGDRMCQLSGVVSLSDEDLCLMHTYEIKK
jgi:hypothetical protein